jgi:hypothetical protein
MGRFAAMPLVAVAVGACVALHALQRGPDAATAAHEGAAAAPPPPRADRPGAGTALPPGHPFAAPRSEMPAQQTSLAALQDRVDALADEVAQLRAQMAPAGSAPAAGTAPARERVRRGPEALAADRQAARGRDAARESAFRAEPVDTAWASGTAARMRSVLAAVPGIDPGAVRSIDCRSRGCRIELALENGPALNQALTLLGQHFAGAMGTMTANTPDEGDGAGNVTVLHLSR